MHLFLEEIGWVLQKAFDSGEFREKPFELGWLTLPKSSRKCKKIRNKVVLQKLDFRDCDKNEAVIQSIAELVQHLRTRSDPKIAFRKDSTNYRIKKRNVDRVDVDGLGRDFGKFVRDELKSFFKRQKKNEIFQREIKKKGNIYYIEVVSPNGIGKVLSGASNSRRITEDTRNSDEDSVKRRLLSSILNPKTKHIQAGLLGLSLDEKSRSKKEGLLVSWADFKNLSKQRVLVKFCLIENFSSTRRELDALLSLTSSSEKTVKHFINRSFFSRDLDQYNLHLEQSLHHISTHFDANLSRPRLSNPRIRRHQRQQKPTRKHLPALSSKQLVRANSGAAGDGEDAHD